MTRRMGFAWSCSPRCFIRSSIVCGRDTFVSTCLPGGVTVVVAVVFAFSSCGLHPESTNTQRKQPKSRTSCFRQYRSFAQCCFPESYRIFPLYIMLDFSRPRV